MFEALFEDFFCFFFGAKHSFSFCAKYESLKAADFHLNHELFHYPSFHGRLPAALSTIEVLNLR